MINHLANRLPKPLRVAFVLPGLGRVQRGAETAFLELARHLAEKDDLSIELFGSGPNMPTGLNHHTVAVSPRERFENWPKVAPFRNENVYEEAGFTFRLITQLVRRLRKCDVAVHCSFPFVNWILQAGTAVGGPRSIFVTQNGDWMCQAASREFRTFKCHGLVCTNPAFFAKHRDRYQACLIPNGVDTKVYYPGPKLLIRQNWNRGFKTAA